MYGPSYNLIEGNNFQKAQFSFSDGHEENGPYNVFIRNKAEDYDGNGWDAPNSSCANIEQWLQNFILSEPSGSWKMVWICGSPPHTASLNYMINSSGGVIEDHSNHGDYVYSYYKTSQPDFLVGHSWPYYHNGGVNAAEYRSINNIYQENELWDNYFCRPMFPQYKIFLATEYVTYWDTIQAGKKITAEDYLVLTQSADVNFIAGEEIELLPGFTVGTGATFKGFIGSCGTPAQKKSDPDITQIDFENVKNNQLIIPEGNKISPGISIEIYPNPTEDIFYLHSSMALSGMIKSIEVYDFMGNHMDAKINLSDENIYVDLSDTAEGAYFVKIYLSNGIQIVKKKLLRYRQILSSKNI